MCCGLNALTGIRSFSTPCVDVISLPHLALLSIGSESNMPHCPAYLLRAATGRAPLGCPARAAPPYGARSAPGGKGISHIRLTHTIYTSGTSVTPTCPIASTRGRHAPHR